MSGWRHHIAVGLSLLSSGLATTAQAAPRQMPWEATPPPSVSEDRLRLEVGVWNAKIDTQIRSDATSTQPGTLLDGESDVGLSDGGPMADFELTLFPGQRQLFRLNGFSSHRRGAAILNQNVLYNGNLYTANSPVQSVLNLDMVGVGYAYRLIKRPKLEWDVGIDLQVLSAEANVYVVGQPRESNSGAAPLPLLDTEVRWQVWRDVQLLGRYRWLGASVKDGTSSGTVRDWRYGLAWQFNPHLNVGVYQRHFGIDVNIGSGSNPGALQLKYAGWELSFRASL